MPVAIAVVSWNTRDLLAGCLHSIEPAAAAGIAEVWVVDNASTDGSAEMVATSFPWVHLITAERNLGFGAAVNAVARRAGASAWIAPANADIVVRPGALEAMLKAGEADPAAGIIAPALIRADGSTQHSVHPFPGLGASLALNLGLARLSPRLGERLALDGRWDQHAPRRVDWAHGAFLLIRRRAFDQVDGFDPGQFLYAEDLDIAWRLARAGWHTRYEPSAKVDHVQGAAIRQFYGEDGDLRAQRSAYAWMLRRRGPALMRTCALINLAGAGARAAAVALNPGRRSARGLPAWELRRHARMHLNGLIASRRRLEEHP